MSYPILYKANESDFSTLGLGVLTDATSALVTEERNGLFELTMEYPLKGKGFDKIKVDRLIKVDAGPKLKDQRFKIIRITKPLKGIVTVYAEHVSYITQDLPLAPLVKYNGTAQSALNTWKNAIVDQNPLSVYSDISTLGSGEWRINEVENARRALGGVRGSILDSYGGEYLFDNYRISLLKQRGKDDRALIAYGKNLLDLEQEEEIANTYTSIYPYSIIRDEDGTEELVTLPEYYVDSDYVSNFARRKILVVDFSEEEISNVDSLRSRAKRYVEENDVGIPKVNLRVKFIDLSKTLDYKHLKLIEDIGLCDWVVIYFEDLDIYEKAKVIKTIWNVLLDRYEEIELGESRASLSKSIGATVDERLEPVISQLNFVQVAANGKNRVFRGSTRPESGLKVGDLWYRPVDNGEYEMYQWDGSDWELIIGSGVNQAVNDRINEAKGIAEGARENAQNIAADLKAGTSFYEHANNIGLASINSDGTINSIINIDGDTGIPYIKGKHIILDGDTTVDGTFVVTEDMFADTLTVNGLRVVGVLDASRDSLNIINLNAESITSGKINNAILQNTGIATFGDVDNAIMDIQTIDDTRDTNSSPSWYQDNYPKQKVREFKRTATMGIGTALETYGVLETEIPWSDSSGGRVKQSFFVSDKIFTRSGTGASWSSWKESPNTNELSTAGQTIINGGNITTGRISDRNGVTTIDLANGQIITRHVDGSQTRMDSAGLYHREGNTNYETSYLADVIPVSGLQTNSGTPLRVTLPSIYRGKNFKARVAFADAYGQYNSNLYGRLAVSRLVCFVDSTNTTNGTVDLIGYNRMLDIQNLGAGAYYFPIQVQLIVTF